MKKIIFLIILIIVAVELKIQSAVTAQTNSAPDCSGGITVQGRQPVEGKYLVNQGESVLLIANGITDPDGDPVAEIQNVIFRHKRTDTPTSQQCPTTDDGSDLGNGTLTFLSGNAVWSITYNTTGLQTGDYFVWANPSDGQLYCTGNPFANGSNLFCGAPVQCTNCSAIVTIQVVAPTSTPTPQPPQCSGGITVLKNNVELPKNTFDIYMATIGDQLTLTANNVTAGTNPLSEMRFAYKSITVNACPPDPGVILLDPLDTNPADGFSINWNTNNLAASTYDVWGTPRDTTSLGCSGNPFANSTNLYCGVNFACTDCNSVISFSLPPTATPDSCPRGDSGNLDCSLNGCIDSADFSLFQQKFGWLVTAVPGYPIYNLFTADGSGFIDTADYEIFRQNFGSCTP